MAEQPGAGRQAAGGAQQAEGGAQESRSGSPQSPGGVQQSSGGTQQAPADAPAYAALAAGFGRLNAVARADSAVGTPRNAGERTIIPLAEVYYGGGFGLGGGSGPASPEVSGSGMGGGGGFGGRVRPVAVVEVGPEGLRVRPVFDASAIGLALAAAGLAVALRLWRRPRRRA
ncbi:MAG TPA: spore germination protein GerW family protein [Chloroflexota bacterium]|nr:spore germination protein GerW family protein [Chloroflexota bacterium]